MIKGKNHHVMPDENGWMVVDEASQLVTQHFDTQEEAIAHATQSAQVGEGEVLIHTTPCSPTQLSTVALPQRKTLPGEAHAVEHTMASKAAGQKASSQQAANAKLDNDSDYDPMLGYDEYYFDI